MLQVGQIRKNNNTSYLTPIGSYDYGFVRVQGYDSNYLFDDFALYLEEGFKAGTTYYIRFTVKRPEEKKWSEEGYLDSTAVDFSLKLYEDNGGAEGRHEGEKIQTVESLLKLEPRIPEVYDTYKVFETVFSPDSTYKYLSFQVARTGYDYRITAREPFVPPDPQALGREPTIFEDEDGYDICKVNNILPSNILVDKIGIQSRPGGLFVINNEPFRLGRSGIFEVNNELRIGFVGLAAPNGDESRNIPHFILDYGYDK